MREVTDFVVSSLLRGKSAIGESKNFGNFRVYCQDSEMNGSKGEEDWKQGAYFLWVIEPFEDANPWTYLRLQELAETISQDIKNRLEGDFASVQINNHVFPPKEEFKEQGASFVNLSINLDKPLFCSLPNQVVVILYDRHGVVDEVFLDSEGNAKKRCLLNNLYQVLNSESSDEENEIVAKIESLIREENWDGAFKLWEEENMDRMEINRRMEYHTTNNTPQKWLRT